MLSKERRFPIQSLPLRGFERKYSKASFFLLKKYPEKEGRARFAVSVAKKVVLKAVDRNILKRLIYRIIQEKFLSLPSGKYFIIIQKTGNQEEIIKDLSSLFYV
ncbi:MAG: ribonuclease P protein component [Candidatus Harrisonbacteria bacterium]|nr:ribonuclease P protein component [Candidatus Harrisonbacteria bacterium]